MTQRFFGRSANIDVGTEGFDEEKLFDNDPNHVFRFSHSSYCGTGKLYSWHI
jgi:hypothetical protein